MSLVGNIRGKFTIDPRRILVVGFSIGGRGACGLFTHWMADDVPADGAELKPTAGKTLRNDFGREGYCGPCPPHAHGAHRYYIAVFALEVASLELPGRTRDDLEMAIKGHTLAKAGRMAATIA